MKKTSVALALVLGMTFTAAHAGGPVIIDDNIEVVADKPGSIGILPVILIAVALCAALCGDEEPQKGCAADLAC